jgi:hypothetical protein
MLAASNRRRQSRPKLRSPRRSCRWRLRARPKARRPQLPPRSPRRRCRSQLLPWRPCGF